MFELLTQWKPQWPKLRTLELVRDGGATYVLDTRTCAVRERHAVDALDLAVLDACDAGVGDCGARRRAARAGRGPRGRRGAARRRFSRRA